MRVNFDDFVEVKLTTPEDFLRIKETLTRIGIASNKTKTLYQSCHILHKQGKYAIVHFKELLALDGRKTNFDDDDAGRRNTIIALLAEWNLLSVVNPSDIVEPTSTMKKIKIIQFKEKSKWNFVSKYTIGVKKPNGVESKVLYN